MKQTLLSLILSIFSLPFLVNAQWEKCLEQKNILAGLDYVLWGGDLAHYKNTTIISSFIEEEFIMYYSNDRGLNWSKLKLPVSGALGNYKNYTQNNLAINELGIFYIEKTQSNGFGYELICHTKDLGVSWTIDTLPLSNMSIGLISEDKNIYYTLGEKVNAGIRQIHKYNNNTGKWQLHYDFTVPKQNEGQQIFSISKNRMVYSYQNLIYIRDATTRDSLNIFTKKGDANDKTSEIACSAVDSIVVYYYRKFGQSFIDVSKDLGKTWRSSAVALPYSLTNLNFAISKAVRVVIKNNKIFVAGETQVLSSDNFGITWQPVLTGNALINPSKITNFIVTDSLWLVQNNYKNFTKKPNETGWGYANNTFADFRSILKLNDSLLWAIGKNYQRLSSKDQGRTWRLDMPHDTVGVFWYNRLIKDGKIYTNNGLISSDGGQTWQASPIPSYQSYQIVGDTIFILNYNKDNANPYRLYYATKAPYTQWTVALVALNITKFYYNNGIIYYNFFDFANPQKVIKRQKLDGTQLPNIITDEVVTDFSVNNNKIGFSVTTTNPQKVGFSTDNGLTSQKYLLPNTPSSQYTVFRTGNYILISKRIPRVCGKLTATTGGIYLSADEGKSWFLFSEGIQSDCARFDAIFYQIDSFVYIKSEYGLWRTKIANLRLTSLTGSVFLDKNKNGIRNADEQGLPNTLVYLAKTGGFTTTDSLGNYAFVVDLKEADTLRASFDNRYATYTPPYLLVNQSDTLKNLGVYLPETLKDLSVNVTAIRPPRSGFNNDYVLTYKNNGAFVRNGKVTYQYAAKQTLIHAAPTPTSNLNNTLSWDYLNLKPNETRTINFTFTTAADVPIRSLITNVATIEPIIDDTLKSNNIDSLIQIVVGSYDPNDKQVAFQNNKPPPSVIDPNAEMIYTIRFQNTGTFQADFVRVIDTLSEKLDITTLRMLASSHNYTLTVKNKNVLLFDFNPIYLPDSTTSEKLSHGFIKFAIKPKKVLAKEESIKNTAYIYFDYNPAIITNTVETANQKINSLFTPSVSEAILVFPNPTNGAISFKLDNFQGREISINIYTIDGRLVFSQNTVGDAVNTINGDSLTEGLYILQVKSDTESAVGRFVVKK
jgi:hypothetical protein